MNQILISFKEEQLKMLRRESKLLGLSVAAMVRLIVSKYFLENKHRSTEVMNERGMMNEQEKRVV